MRNTLFCTIINQAVLKPATLIFAVLFVVGCSGPVYKPAHKSSYYGKPQYSKPAYSGKTNNHPVLSRAKSMLGVPYRYGGNHPSTGFDCSGFVQYTHAAAGIDLPRTTSQQLRATHPITRQQLRPGDLVFFRINRKRFVSHVGIYLGNGKFIHSPSSGKNVSVASLNNPYWRKVYSSAGRVF